MALLKGFDKMIKKSAQTADEKKAKKKEAPKVTLPDELSPELDNFLEAKKEMKEAKGIMSAAEQPIIAFCRSEQDRQKSTDSFDVTNGKATVKYVPADSFSVSQDPEVHEELQNIFGDDYDKVIETETSITMKPEVFQDEKLQQSLVKKLGDNFADFFDTTETLKVKKGFAQKVYALVDDPNTLERVRSLIIQKKPSLR